MPDKITQIKVGSSTYDIEPAASSTLQVDNAAPTLAWGATSVVGTVDGVDLSVKMPANPVSYGGSATALGSSSGGAAATVSRSDHVHAVPALTSCSGTLTVAKGGTGATDAATARTNLGITLTNLGAAASSHPHGNITSSGTITSTAVTSATGVLVYDSSNKIQRATAANARSIIGAGTSNLALGETSTTAYRGDRGKIAYDHSQAAHAPSNAEKNQNAFSNVKVGSTTIAADTTTDTLELVGSNVTLTPDATNDKVTIGITKTNVTTALGYTPPTADTNTTLSGIGTCTTGASTAAKVVVLPGFALSTNQTILIRVSTTNSATSGVTLNVNSTGAKSIYIGDSAWSTSNQLNAGDYLATYDGTYWKLTRIYLTDNNTTYTNAKLGQGYGTCTTAEATAAKVVTLSSYTLTAGGIVAVKFTYAVPASATMNINSKGAKNVYYKGAAITAGIIKAGDIATFIYDGTQYHLLAIDRWQKDVADHIANTSNPHGVTKSQVGLGSVVNTGDSATPVSGGTTKFTTGGAYTELAKKAPTSHASTATTYGIGTSSNYGHVKLSDSTSSTSAASAGIAASPKAVKAAYDKAVEAYNLASSGGFTYGTEDLVAGTSPLATGQLYFVYE